MLCTGWYVRIKNLIAAYDMITLWYLQKRGFHAVAHESYTANAAPQKAGEANATWSHELKKMLWIYICCKRTTGKLTPCLISFEFWNRCTVFLYKRSILLALAFDLGRVYSSITQCSFHVLSNDSPGAASETLRFASSGASFLGSPRSTTVIRKCSESSLFFLNRNKHL